jgi:hypothetical protein
MNDRAHAIAILRQARDILARRLTEQILQLEEELLDDARGETYLGEIETVYEQIAVRLSHVNSMLNHLPADEGAPLTRPGAARSSDTGLVRNWPVGECSDEPLFQVEATPIVPAADTLTSPLEVTAVPTVVTFESFARHVLCDDLEWAGRSLAVLFGVDEELGRRCAATFHARLSQSPERMTQLLQLRRELQEGGIHVALRLLSDCFGLEGLESMSVLQTLRARLIGHNEAA